MCNGSVGVAFFIMAQKNLFGETERPNKGSLEEKIENAIKILRMPRCDEIELSYSGGKDSDVILELAKMAGINYRAIYKNTTIDPPGTIKHCKEMGVEILNPKISFFDIVRKKGFPTRRARFCCEKLKEYKVLDNAIQGIRRSESTGRAKRYNENDPIICRIYGSKKNHVNVALPILNWTDRDIESFIKLRAIKCHPLYYDAQGVFHVERRLGCLGCPLATDNGLSDFKKYPKLVRAWCNAGAQFLETHPHSSARAKIGDAYDIFVQDVFFDSLDKFQLAKEGAFGKIDSKSFLENYFDIEL